MRHFIELTLSDKSPVLIAVEEIQAMSEGKVAGTEDIRTLITLRDMTIHVRETYAEVKAKLHQFNN